MTAALYRVNFVFHGSGRSLLKLLPDLPSVGEHLSFENVGLVVTEVTHEPAGQGIAATVQAVVDPQEA